jgi:hypothetical protein
VFAKPVIKKAGPALFIYLKGQLESNPCSGF